MGISMVHQTTTEFAVRTMNRAIFILCVIGCAEAAAQGSPLVGKWTWTRSDNNCTETYDYRADGSFSALSGQEVASGTYEISPKPDGNGFFTLTVRTLKTNGAKDCSDSGPQPGQYDQPQTVYVIFHRAEPVHIVCMQRSLEACFGPLRRMPQ